MYNPRGQVFSNFALSVVILYFIIKSFAFYHFQFCIISFVSLYFIISNFNNNLPLIINYFVFYQ